MKKLSLVLLAFLAFSFVGCQEWLDIPDPEPEPEPEPEPVEEALIMLEETSATLHYGETYQINAECESPITYSSEDEYYASVSEEGLVTANFVGATTINLESEFDAQTFEVTIEPVSNLYPEPEIEIGESKESIIERFGEPFAETEETIGYQDYSDNTTMLMVLFDENDLVENYALILDVELEEELETFLSERYPFVQEMEGMKIYVNALNPEEASLIIGSQVYEDEEESFLMVVYGSNTSEPEEKSVSMKALLKALGK